MLILYRCLQLHHKVYQKISAYIFPDDTENEESIATEDRYPDTAPTLLSRQVASRFDSKVIMQQVAEDTAITQPPIPTAPISLILHPSLVIDKTRSSFPYTDSQLGVYNPKDGSKADHISLNAKQDHKEDSGGFPVIGHLVHNKNKSPPSQRISKEMKLKRKTCVHDFVLDSTVSKCHHCSKLVHHLRDPGYLCSKCGYQVDPLCKQKILNKAMGQKTVSKGKELILFRNIVMAEVAFIISVRGFPHFPDFKKLETHLSTFTVSKKLWSWKKLTTSIAIHFSGDILRMAPAMVSQLISGAKHAIQHHLKGEASDANNKHSTGKEDHSGKQATPALEESHECSVAVTTSTSLRDTTPSHLTGEINSQHDGAHVKHTLISEGEKYLSKLFHKTHPHK